MSAEETMLILVSAGENHNKFYHLKLDDDGTLTKTYGRVGTTGTTIVDRVGGKRTYDSTMRAKMRKGYKPTEVSGSGVANTSGNGGDQARVREIARKTLIAAGDSELERLIDLLVAKNNHEIIEASGGQMKVSEDGIITTPLGLVSKTSINNAKKLLADIEQLRHSARRSALLNDYLTLIPQKVPGRRGWDEYFLAKPDEVASQRDFLRQLEESIVLHDERVSAAVAAEDSSGDTEDELASKYADLFRYKVSVLEDEKEFKRIAKFFEKGRNSMHSSSNMNLKRVYLLEDPVGQEKFAKKLEAVGNNRELWHGTRVWNILSILRRGLMIEAEKDISTVQINGKMFSRGGYFSDQATKSLSYSEGFWDRGQRHDNCFMFLTDVAMGRTHMAKRGVSYSGGHIQKSGKWDSIFAKGGVSDVRNNEMIVWDADQISLKYLCEFSR